MAKAYLTAAALERISREIDVHGKRMGWAVAKIEDTKRDIDAGNDDGIFIPDGGFPAGGPIAVKNGLVLFTMPSDYLVDTNVGTIQPAARSGLIVNGR